MDRWILSRMAYALEETDAALKVLDLPRATAAAFYFWLTDLCDYYIESSKVFLRSKESEGESADNKGAPSISQSEVTPLDQERVRNILYWTMHVGLRLLAPYMPFLTEELFQRMLLRAVPASDTAAREKIARTAPSICVNPFPRPHEVVFKLEALGLIF